MSSGTTAPAVHERIAQLPPGAERHLLLTTDEAAVLVGVAGQTLRRWRSEYNAGQDLQGPPWCVVGARSIRYRLEDVTRYVAARAVAG